MTFEEIEIAAHKNDVLPKNATLEEQMGFLCLRSLYNDYRKHTITRMDATKEKNAIKQSFARAVEEHSKKKEAWAQYQENIRLAGTLRSRIQKETNVATIALLACECVGRMCGEMTSYQIMKKTLEDGNLRTEVEKLQESKTI